jgi:hypothetical protein
MPVIVADLTAHPFLVREATLARTCAGISEGEVEIVS